MLVNVLATDSIGWLMDKPDMFPKVQNQLEILFYRWTDLNCFLVEFGKLPDICLSRIKGWFYWHLSYT